MNYSIIQKSQLEGSNRLDAEYYQPEYLEVEELLRNQPFKTIKQLSDGVFSGPFGSTLTSESYIEEGIPFVRISNIQDVFVRNDGLVFISEEEHKRIYSSHLSPGDLVLSKIGTVGRLSVIPDELGEVNISENNIGIRISNLSSQERASLLFFLLSRYGQNQIVRRGSGNIQLKLNISDIEDIKIPIFNDAIESRLFFLYKQVINLDEQSRLKYLEAENLLLEELGLKDFKPREDLSFVVNYSDVKKAERMDADYFQPKYAEILERIKNTNGKKLEDLASIKKGIEPGSEAYQEEGKHFIRVSSLSKNGIDNKDQKYLSEDLYQQLKADFEPKVGEIILTKDATPGVAFVIKENIEGIISGGILRLQLKEEIEPEYLALCLNSIIGKMQAEKDCGGSIIIHWRPEQIKNVSIPILSKSTQLKIADLVRKSHEARKKSKELLEEAKRKVEEMIEKGDKK